MAQEPLTEQKQYDSDGLHIRERLSHFPVKDKKPVRFEIHQHGNFNYQLHRKQLLSDAASRIITALNVKHEEEERIMNVMSHPKKFRLMDTSIYVALLIVEFADNYPQQLIPKRDLEDFINDNFEDKLAFEVKRIRRYGEYLRDQLTEKIALIADCEPGFESQFVIDIEGDLHIHRTYEEARRIAFAETPDEAQNNRVLEIHRRNKEMRQYPFSECHILAIQLYTAFCGGLTMSEQYGYDLEKWPVWTWLLQDGIINLFAADPDFHKDETLYSGMNNVVLPAEVCYGSFQTVMSTSRNLAVAHRFANHGGIDKPNLIIEIPPEVQRALYCADVSWLSVHSNEDEVVFCSWRASDDKRGQKFRCQLISTTTEIVELPKTTCEVVRQVARLELVEN